MVTSTVSADVLDAVRAIPDPEIPAVSIADLGILRELTLDTRAGRVEAVITPTYSGCPAMRAIEDQIARVCRAHGFSASVRTRLSPAWTTDWIGADARERLRAYGIAPPGAVGESGPMSVAIGRRTVACPRCGSVSTTEVAHFGSTACKALRRCDSCGEPFDEFKAF